MSLDMMSASATAHANAEVARRAQDKIPTAQIRNIPESALQGSEASLVESMGLRRETVFDHGEAGARRLMLATALAGAGLLAAMFAGAL